jgi:tRNA pseudouridine55 synthase
MTDGIVVVDKPAGWTSHDVVARLRRLFGTRRVGHAGTLDPLATGVLVVGVGRATRLLGYLARFDKEYVATVTLGVRTATDDAEGDVVSVSPVTVAEARLASAMAALSGTIEQVPPSYSAVKVAGRRSYARARAGQAVTLPPRVVTVSAFDLLRFDSPEMVARVVCSSGTYVRALARDLGQALGCGAHLSALRRTRVGPFHLAASATVAQLSAEPHVIALADAVGALFPCWRLDAAQAERLRNGGRLVSGGLPAGPVGAFGPSGEVVALVIEQDGLARPTVVFPSTTAPSAD